jgi:hypothetical protein
MQQQVFGPSVVVASTTLEGGAVVYRFALVLHGAALCDFGGRYSMLALLHSNALARFAVRTGAVFPPKAPLQNMVRNAANVQGRAAALAAYFTRLLQWPNVGDAELLAILQVPPAAQQQLGQLAGQLQAEAEARNAAARQAAEMAAAAQRAAAEAAAREAANDVALAQAANQLSAFTGSVGPGALPSLTYPKPMRFMLRTKIWSSACVLRMSPRLAF